MCPVLTRTMQSPHRSTLLDRILAEGGLSCRFQPIYDLRTDPPRIVASECLTRGPKGSSLEAPDLLFEYARRKREEAVVDRAAVATALRAARSLPAHLPLQVNVHASTLGRDRAFVRYLDRVAAAEGMSLARLTIEILEHSDPVDEETFLIALEELRERGVGVALDDIGLGRSNFRMILLARPGLMKIDRYLVQGIHADAARRAVLLSLKLLNEFLGSLLVAEGVESAEDLEVLRELKTPLAQGFQLCRPLAAGQLADLLARASTGDCRWTRPLDPWAA